MSNTLDQRRSRCLYRACVLISLAATSAHGQQIAKLTAEDGAAWDWFGRRVALSGDTAIVGSVWDSDAGQTSGSAYIFRETGSGWQQIAKLTADDAAAEDYFGIAVSLSGDTAIVGAAQDDDAGENSGSAYVYREVGGAWVQIAKLIPDDAATGNEFGTCVAIDGDTAVVGGRYGGAGGSSYVFREVGGAWRQIAALDAGEGQADDGIAISGDTVLIGAAWDGTPGSVHVFREGDGGWGEIARLVADDRSDGDFFGVSVSLSGDTAIVGADLDDDAGENSGSAYVFREVDGEWRQIAKLTAKGAAAYDYFGVSVSVSGDTAVVGAYLDDLGHHLDRGSAYVFQQAGGAWQQVSRLTASNGAFEDYFGVSVAISGGTAVVGVSQDDDAGENSGSAYVFRVQQSCVADFNGDGVVDTRDVLAFLNAWASGSVATDLDGDGTIDTRDLLAFLNAWAVHC